MDAPPTLPASGVRAAAWVLAAAAIAVVLAGAPSRVFDLERYTLPKELVLHAAALALLLLLPLRRPMRADTVDLLLAGFVGWGIVSAALAANPWLAARGAGLSFSTVVVFMAARRVASEGRGGRVVAGLLCAAAVAAVIGAAEAYGLEWIWHSDTRGPGGSFGNRNAMGHYLAISLPLAVVAAVHARKPGPRALAALVAALLALTLVLTRSRAAWLGAGAGLGLTLLLLLLAPSRPRLQRLVVPLALMLVAGAAAVLVPNRLAWRSDSPYAQTLTALTDYRGGSGRGRLIQYGHSLELLREAPLLGVGPGNWFVHYPRVTKPGDPSYAGHLTVPTNPWPSSDWVALLTERGLPGALLLGLAGLAAVTGSVRRLRSAGADPWSGAPAAAGAAGILAAALVTGLFDAVLLLAAPALLLGAAVGTLLPRGGGRDVPGARRPLRFAAAGIALVLVLLTGTWTAAVAHTAAGRDRATLASAARLAPGEHRLRLLLAERGGCSARLPHARAAAQLLPHHDAARRALRACGG